MDSKRGPSREDPRRTPLSAPPLPPDGGLLQGGPAQPPLPLDPAAPPPVGMPPPPPPDPDGADTLPLDLIGDIPPPPIPAPPPIVGPGVGGIPGTEAGTFARPGTSGAAPFRSPAYQSPRPPRFGPGVPQIGAGGVTPDSGLGISPEDAAELLASMSYRAGGSRGQF